MKFLQFHNFLGTMKTICAYLIEVVSSWDVLKHSWVFEGVVDWTSSWTNMAACDWLIPPYIPLAYILHSESLLSKLFILAISRNCRILWRFLALSVTCKKENLNSTRDRKSQTWNFVLSHQCSNLWKFSLCFSYIYKILRTQNVWSWLTTQSWYCFCHNKNAADPDPSWLALLRNTSDSDIFSSSSNNSRVLATQTWTFFVSWLSDWNKTKT